MHEINWQQFGLKKNPYDIAPLKEGGDMPIETAFVGRVKEREFLDSLFGSMDRICLTICGDVGVGKTSLANFHKYIWKHRKQKPLFSFRREIEACDDLLDKKNFLIEIIGSVLREIELLQPNLLSDPLLTRLGKIVDFSHDITIGAGVNFLGLNANLQEEASIPPPQLSAVILEKYFISLIEFIEKTEISGRRYEGLIIHVNNFDVVLSDVPKKKKAVTFFNEIRDIMQIPHIYYLFLGPPSFFKDVISPQQRIKSVFYATPLRIAPLSKTEIVKAFEERMNLLKSDDVTAFIKPVEDAVIFRLYDLYEGDIRSIMAALTDILSQCSEKSGKSLSVDEAVLLLGKHRWENIENELTPEQREILKYLVVADKFISQKEVAKMFKKVQSNVSGYYFKPLKELGIIEEKGKEGRAFCYGLTLNYLPLKWLIESQKQVHKKMLEQIDQLSLF